MSVVQLLVVVIMHICMSSTVASGGKGRIFQSPLQPNVVVAKDGSGQFKTVTEAVASVPKKNTTTFVIFVKAGLYKEQIEIPKGKNNIVLIGEGPIKTIITSDKNTGTQHIDSFHTATFAINGEDFIAKDIAFENTAGSVGQQALALRVSGDKAIFYNIHINGYQDTLFTHQNRQFYRDCLISGTIDFIFGDALAIFQNCVFVFRKPMGNQKCMLTAQGRMYPSSPGAIVIQNSNITAEAAFLAAKPPIQAYLGRPWKQFSRTIIMQSNIGGFVSPEGWSRWQGTDFGLNTCYYGEYQNSGPGSDTSKRVRWKCIQNITPKIGESWSGGRAYDSDEWIRNSGVPYEPGLKRGLNN